MEAVTSSAASANPSHLPLNQLPTFVTQQNAMPNSKQVSSASVMTGSHGESIQHVTSSGGSVMVIQHPGVPTAVGLLASAVSSSNNVPSGTVQGSSEHPHISGLYSTAEYVLPQGSNMISSGGQGFQVHVPVVPQQEGNSEGKYAFIPFSLDYLLPSGLFIERHL